MKESTVLVEALLHEEALGELEGTVRVIRSSAGSEAVRLAREASVVAAIIGARWQMDAEIMDKLPTLLAIGRPGIGVDNVDIHEATLRGITVVNTPDGPTTSTAEHAVSLLLALAKHHKAGARVLATRGSLQAEAASIELSGKVLGIIGLGRIGSAVARICHQGLSMRVIAYDPYVSRATADSLAVELLPELDDLLPLADFISLHAPATPSTVGLICERTLALVKPTAYVVNCSRGSLVDEIALAAAISSGRIAGAGIDVFNPEPPEPANPLLAMEEVVATPHSAFYTDDCRRKMGYAVTEEILSVLNGVRPANMVNPQVWESAARHQRAIAAAKRIAAA